MRIADRRINEWLKEQEADVGGKTVVIYHANCPDGLGAAWAAWKSLGDKGVVYAPANHGDPPPNVKGADKVYLVDFSYPKATLLKMAKEVDGIQILDHHKTAEADLKGISKSAENISVVFDMERSGAAITWDYFHEGERPPFIEYVQDRDLWRFVLPNTEAINDYIRCFIPVGAPDMKKIEGLADEIKNDMKSVVAKASTLTLWKEKVVAQAVASAEVGELDGHKVMHVNSSQYFSEIAGELATKPGVKIGIVYFRRGDGTWQYSLRGRGGFDVSAVAANHGGGGHNDAAGFESKELIF